MFNLISDEEEPSQSSLINLPIIISPVVIGIITVVLIIVIILVVRRRKLAKSKIQFIIFMLSVHSSSLFKLMVEVVAIPKCVYAFQVITIKISFHFLEMPDLIDTALEPAK